MGLRDLFRELGGRTDDAISGRNRLHKRDMFYLGAGDKLDAAEIVVPTNRLEHDLLKLAIVTKLDRTFDHVPSTDTQWAWEGRFRDAFSWASRWFVDAAWSPMHAIRYAIYPEVPAEWSHPDDPRMALYATKAGYHPFFFLYMTVEPVAPHSIGQFEHMLVVAAALDMRDADWTMPNAQVVWMADPKILLGCHGLVLKKLALVPEHPDEARGGRIAYYDEESFEDWPHRILLEAPPREYGGLVR